MYALAGTARVPTKNVWLPGESPRAGTPPTGGKSAGLAIEFVWIEAASVDGRWNLMRDKCFLVVQSWQ